MAQNNELKYYDFVEGLDFDGLMPKAMEGYSIGDGGEAKSNHLFRSAHLGADALEVISINALFEKSGGSEGGGTESGSTESGSTESGETEHEVVKPEETENTAEQEQAAEDVAAGMTADSGSVRYTTSTDSVNNITVPEGAKRTGSISGAVQNGATFTNESSGKSLMIYNTSEEPADVSVVSNGGSVYLKGEYNDIYLSGKSLPVESSQYPNVHGTISVEDTNQPVSVTVNFVGDDCGITYLGEEKLTLSDGVTAVTASPEIYAPNATVEVGGKYDVLTATVSENTLVLKNGFHANKLIVKKGNLVVNGVDIADFADELVLPEGAEVACATFHVTQSSNSKLMSSSPANGKVILDTDIELTKGRSYSILASGKEIIDLNGHTWKCGDTRAETSNLGSYYIRGGASEITIMDSVGGGVFENNHEAYLIFSNGENAVVNLMSGEYRGYTHTIYSLLGSINIYGGTFKLLNAETAERDANGNLKFLLNCYDANYTAGKAKIKVYGGKFYEYNPAVTYGEPGGPVSYVAEGYHVVESVEDGKKVYEVVKD